MYTMKLVCMQGNGSLTRIIAINDKIKATGLTQADAPNTMKMCSSDKSR